MKRIVAGLLLAAGTAVGSTASAQVVSQATPAPSTVYVQDPNAAPPAVVYTQPAPQVVYVQPQPRVVYVTPPYVYPSYYGGYGGGYYGRPGFSVGVYTPFGFGGYSSGYHGGSYHGGSYHGGGHHR